MNESNVGLGLVCIVIVIIGFLILLYWYYNSQSHIAKKLRRFFGDRYGDNDYWNED